MLLSEDTTFYNSLICCQHLTFNFYLRIAKENKIMHIQCALSLFVVKSASFLYPVSYIYARSLEFYHTIGSMGNLVR